LAAAATLCVNPPTALGLLEDFVDVKAGGQAGERAPAIVAQTGATSAVGQLVIQLAHHWGAKTINVIRDRPDWDDTCAWLQAMGADLVTTEARARHDAAEAGLHAGAALALDCVGGTACASVARLLRPGGTLVSYGAMSLQPVTVPASLLIFKDIRVRGYWLSGRRRQRRGAGGDGGADEDEDLLARREMLDRAASLFLQGVWRAPPAETFPLSEVGRGVARAREGKTRTKVLLVPG
jgi:trans-2-enoyl-CoA reductase